MTDTLVEWTHVQSILPQISRFTARVNGADYLLVLTLTPSEWEVIGRLFQIEYEDSPTQFARVLGHAGEKRYRKGLKTIAAGEDRQDRLRAAYDRFFQEWAEGQLAAAHGGEHD